MKKYRELLLTAIMVLGSILTGFYAPSLVAHAAEPYKIKGYTQGVAEALALQKSINFCQTAHKQFQIAFVNKEGMPDVMVALYPTNEPINPEHRIQFYYSPAVITHYDKGQDAVTYQTKNALGKVNLTMRYAAARCEVSVSSTKKDNSYTEIGRITPGLINL